MTHAGRHDQVEGQKEFDYFYGNESKFFSFYMLPKALIDEERFSDLSSDAKILYAILLDLVKLSVKNHWIEKGTNRVYVICSIDTIASKLNRSRAKAQRVLVELGTEKGIGLVEKKHIWHGNPDRLFVKRFITDYTYFKDTQTEDSQIEHAQNDTPQFISGETQGVSGIVQNNTDYSKTNSKNKNKGKKSYGENANVFLTDEEISLLREEFPSDYMERIENLSLYLLSKGDKYKSHYWTIKNWARRDEHKTYRNTKKQPDYTVQEGETI